ncbi:MAG: tRNA (N(6)-L-threonylcarbamoyladenosine(37)-C(2))-methylthiotransferase MtaB [Ignavibacteriaceae bacterium]
MQNKVALHTFGCKLNFSESSSIGKEFLQKGFEITYSDNEADIHVFNTCTVTENAEKDFRQLLRRILRKNPEAYIIVTGCYAQLRPEEIAEIQGVDLILGSNEKFDLFRYGGEFKKKQLACTFVSPSDNLTGFGPAYSSDADNRTRAYLKIQDGCDYKCSFCTIPSARGLSRSMHPDKIISSFNRLLEEGYKEIILTGVNVGDYGKGLNTNLLKLLEKLIQQPGNFRIRISSIEPNLLSDAIIQLVKSSEKICNHFHIPLQSGSPSILKSMQRRYKASYYADLIYKLKEEIPEAGIGADVIVGFPGESLEDFRLTHDMLLNLPVTYLHVFTYSERPGTAAVRLPDSVDIFERRRRNKILRMLGQKKQHIFTEQMKSQQLIVLFESENHQGKIRGFSDNYIRVETDYNEGFVNQFIPVQPVGISEGLLQCKPAEKYNSVDLVTS